MPVDFLKELDLPMLNVENLTKVVKDNTNRLINLIKEHNYFLEENQTYLPGYKKLMVPVSNIGESSHLLTKPSDMVNGNQTLENSTKNNSVDVSDIEPSNSEVEEQNECSAALRKPSDMVNGIQTLENSSKNKFGSMDVYVINSEVEEQNECLVAVEKLSDTVNESQALKNSPKSNSDSMNFCVINSQVEEQNECLVALEENSQERSNCDLVQSNPEFFPVECSNVKNEPEVGKITEGCSNGEQVLGKDTSLCVISEVVGNADGAFYKEDSLPETEQESSLITPQKTKDITKIKGWRRKQFLVEKPTTVEFYRFPEGASLDKVAISVPLEEEKDEDVKNAFVCETLDEFLDRDAELKINYEVPHLYAEFGIKLTSEDIVSRPNLSEEDFKEVEMKYCVPIPLPADIDLDIQDSKRGIKRHIKQEDSESSKLVRLNDDQRVANARVESTQPMLELSEDFIRLSRRARVYQQSRTLRELSKMNLVSKLIGLVVYPGLNKPLHPLVRRHLAKIRSYRTKIDENWANFAASAVLRNRKFYERSILPVYMCGNVAPNPTNEPEFQKNDQDLRGSVSKNSEPPSETRASENQQNNGKVAKKHPNVFVRKIRCLKRSNEKKPLMNLRECRVVLDKAVSVEKWALWCMDHNCYNCSRCGLDKFKPGKPQPPDGVQKRDDNVIASPQSSFDKEISALLAKTLRLKKRANADISTSIDSLKNLTPNTVELIKLNFVKQSFLSGYISIWYLRAETSSVRSRAFLNFSDTPPVPNAVNLKSCLNPSEALPKVITEIVSTENAFDSNEYAIMHCNGEVWEIHGCLNLDVSDGEKTSGKGSKEVEQIFASAPLPELSHLESLAWDILQTKTSKWWVLDLIQKFREIEIESGSLTAVVSRKKFLAFIKLGLFGFISIRKEAGGRVLGAYIFKKLLPFVLIGPYRLFESNGLTVKVDSSTVPFAYYGDKKTNQNNPLKFFIDSVVTEFEDNQKKIEGLWLYDKMFLDNTCFLEVTTTSGDGLFSKKQYSIEIEHNYNLQGFSSPSTSTPEVPESNKSGKTLKKKFIVYLYFEIFELGYVQGELLNNYSVVISHPLDQRTRIESPKIGDLFIGIIKRRIRFIPQNLQLRWFITKHKEDLRGRQPFNKFYLGGAHILCKSGLYFMLQLTESKIEELGLDKNEVLTAIAESKVISEVRELKNLANILASDSNDTENFSMEDVLVMAINEIEKQKKIEKNIAKEKKALKIKNSELCTSYVKSLNACKYEDEGKFKVMDALKIETKDLITEQKDNFEAHPFGQTFLKFFDKKEHVDIGNDSDQKKGSSKAQKMLLKNHDSFDPVIKKLENKLLKIQSLLETKADSLRRPELIMKLNCIYKQLNSIMSIFDEAPDGAVLKKKLRKNKNFIKLNNFVKTIQFLPNKTKVEPSGSLSSTTLKQPSSDSLAQASSSLSFQEKTKTDDDLGAEQETSQNNKKKLPSETVTIE